MKVELVKLTTKFFDEYLDLVNNEEVHSFTEPAAKFKAFRPNEIMTWLQKIQSEQGRQDFAILIRGSGEFVGEVVLNDIEEDSCNIRIAIHPKFFNQGLGTMAFQEAINYAFESLNLVRVILSVYSINERGIHIYKKCGFKEMRRENVADGIEEIFMELYRPFN